MPCVSDTSYQYSKKRTCSWVLWFLYDSYQCMWQATYCAQQEKNRRKQQKVTSSLGTIKAVTAANNDGQKCFIETACSIFVYLTFHSSWTKIIRATKIHLFSLFLLPKELLSQSPGFPQKHFLCLFIINPFLLLLGQTYSPMGLHVALKTNNREPLASFWTIYHCC